MIRSESLDALNAALSAAQGEFEAVAKSAANPFFKSSYSPLPEVVKAATPILAKHGLAVWQGPDVNERGDEVLWTVVLHSSGQYIGSAGKMHPVKDDPQAIGSAITYGRRYNYMAGTGLVADDDDDGNAASQPRPKPVSRTKPAKRPNPPATVSDGHSEVANSPSGHPAREIVNDITLSGLRETIKASGKSDDDVAWCLLSVGVESLPKSPSRDDLKSALQGLTVDQALRLDGLLTDDAVPGSGAS